MELATIDIQLRAFDSLELAPDIIKIDVEGAEPNVLRGMRTTLEKQRPLLLLERSTSFDTCQTILGEAGYDILVYDPATDRLCDISDNSHSTNFFALPK